MPRKPRQARSLATVDAIIDAGFLCVCRHGLQGATTNHIAAAAGLSTGSVYEYFANKEAIYAAMVQRFLADVEKVVLRLGPDVARMDIPDAIRTLAFGFHELLAGNNGRYLPLLRGILLADTREVEDLVSKLLTNLVLQYLLNHPQYMRLGNLQTRAYIIINSGIFNVLRHLSAENPPMPFSELVDGLVEFVTFYVAQAVLVEEVSGT